MPIVVPASKAQSEAPAQPVEAAEPVEAEAPAEKPKPKQTGPRVSEADLEAARREAAGYAAERDAALPPHHEGPRPNGGVGGTRVGVKCLHAHYAWFLAGGDDPVGAWVHAHLDEVTA